MSSAALPLEGSPGPSGMLSLPDEIIEQVFLWLDLNSRLRLRSACRTLRDTYNASAPLQYRFTLDTARYLDVPNRPRTGPSSSGVEGTAKQGPASPTSPASRTIDMDHDDATKSISFRSPHTGRLRQTIPSVTLPPWPKEPARLVQSDSLVSATDKNAVLRAREKRWETLDWAEKRTLKVSGKEGVYELQEGIFLMCDDFNDMADDKPSTVRLIPLPSTQDPDLEDPPIQTSASRVSFPISDLTMDPTQDLIVVSEFRPDTTDANRSPPTHRYHLLSLSTFQPHPCAKLPTLDFPPFSHAIMDTRQLLQVMGDTLCVLVSRYAPPWVLAGLGLGIGALGGLGHEEEVVAWNWRTGKVLARMSLPENGWFASFALLSPTTLMITSTSNISPILPTEPRSQGHIFPPVIQIYSFAPDPNNPMDPVQPLDTDPMDDTTPRPVLLAQMELPRFAFNVMIAAFDVRPDPPFPVHQPGTGPTLGKGKPFTQDPSKGILVFELRLVAPPGQEHRMMSDRKKSYELFVLRETLVKAALQGEERLRQAWANGGDYDGLGIRGVERTIPWAEWGEHGARLMDAQMKRRSWVCSCSGYRFVSLTPAVWPRSQGGDGDLDVDNGDDDGEIIPVPRWSDLHLLDFSPALTKRDWLERAGAEVYSPDEGVIVHQGPDWEAIVHMEPTVLDKADVWKEDVTSRLPYREVRKTYGAVANGVMCDDQRIIVVHTQSRENGDWSVITQELTVLCM
ncbi:hypothetical protein IAU60_004230 [Kwoniella sp. DSM 27419]